MYYHGLKHMVLFRHVRASRWVVEAVCCSSPRLSGVQAPSSSLHPYYAALVLTTQNGCLSPSHHVLISANRKEEQGAKDPPLPFKDLFWKLHTTLLLSSYSSD